MQFKYWEDKYLQQGSKEMSKINELSEDQTLTGSFEDKPIFKSIFTITPLFDNTENANPAKTDEILTKVAEKIESNQVKIVENIKSTSSNDFNIQGFSYEVNIKLNNSREELHDLTYFESIETLNGRKDSGEKLKIAPSTNIKLPDNYPKPSKPAKKMIKPKNKKSKCQKVCTCCCFIMSCIL
ncbi:hypothetical protein ACKWTF_016168 [Chironomus riparius]